VPPAATLCNFNPSDPFFGTATCPGGTSTEFYCDAPRDSTTAACIISFGFNGVIVFITTVFKDCTSDCDCNPGSFCDGSLEGYCFGIKRADGDLSSHQKEIAIDHRAHAGFLQQCWVGKVHGLVVLFVTRLGT